MGRKKKHPEHVNLERWLVSYADFMTLMFATFVALYALSQTDAAAFDKLNEAMKRAFNSNIFDGSDAILDGGASMLEGYSGASNPVMLEYLSPKYEENSYESIKKSIDNMNIDGLNAEIDDRGLVVKLENDALTFESGSARISKDSFVPLDEVAKLIKKYFAIHLIRVEGHTDSDPLSSPVYPSNWELSAARASSVVRHLIDQYQFNPKIFIAAGYADTVPIAKSDTVSGKQKNRRVEIIVLKNSLKNTSSKHEETLGSLGAGASTGINPTSMQAIQQLSEEEKKMQESAESVQKTYENEATRLHDLEIEQVIERPDFLE